MENKLKAVVFDFDGTIVNSFELIFRAFQAGYFKVTNEVIPPQDISSYFGPTERGSFLKIFDNKEDALKAFDGYLEYYTLHHDEYIERVDQELISIFKTLKDKGIKIFVLTGRSYESLMISLDKLNIKQYFDGFYSGSDERANKVDNFYKLEEDNNLLPSEIIYVGDNYHDIVQCEEAKIKIISTLVFLKFDEEKIRQRNSLVCETFSEMKNILEELV